MQQVASIRVIITNKNEQLVLLIKKPGVSSGEYCLPGAPLYADDKPKVVALTVVKNITNSSGVEPQLIDATSVLDQENHKNDVTLIYKARVSDDVIDTTRNRQNVIWADDQSLLSLPLDTETELLSKRAMAYRKGDLKLPVPTGRIPFKSDSSRKLLVYTDGGSRGNPGPSAAGYVIFDDTGTVIHEGGAFLGITTNSQAEYQAVKLALEKAQDLGAEDIEMRLDSLLVVNQMKGVYAVRNRDLWPIHEYILNLVKRFKRVRFIHVKREDNRLADGMVNRILDSRLRAEVK